MSWHILTSANDGISKEKPYIRYANDGIIISPTGQFVKTLCGEEEHFGKSGRAGLLMVP
jgi:hypothetical protein